MGQASSARFRCGDWDCVCSDEVAGRDPEELGFDGDRSVQIVAAMPALPSGTLMRSERSEQTDDSNASGLVLQAPARMRRKGVAAKHSAVSPTAACCAWSTPVAAAVALLTGGVGPTALASAAEPWLGAGGQRQVARAAAGKRHGFGYAQVGRMSLSFRKYDLDEGGTLEGKEIANFVEDVLPEIAVHAAFRPRLLELISAAGASEPNVVLRLEDFLHLMKKVREYRFEEYFAKEQGASKAAGFGPQEVAEWREIFLDAIESAGHQDDRRRRADACGFDRESISAPLFVSLFARIAPMNATHQAQLRNIFEKATHGHDHADFPVFLLLMRQSMDANFAGMGHLCSSTAPKAETLRQQTCRFPAS